ncbi:S-layer homology domain-containing protein [Candidatus Peregrinibacteria bacterium]|nr:S-layer homology domain-containing protein [Candidatus Peregrinibacteria bacterium]
MFKKILSGFILSVTMFTLIPLSAFAVNIPTTFVTSLQLTVSGGGTASSFKPKDGQVLTVNVTLDTVNLGSQLNKSSGYVKVKQSDKVIKTLANWDISQSGSLPSLSNLTWDGKLTDGTADANAICGTVGAVCPDGAYKVEAYVQSVIDASNTLTDTKSADLTLTTGLPLSVNSFTTGTTLSGASFDPSSSGNHETLTVNYGLNDAANSLQIDIKNPTTTVKTFIASTPQEKTSGTMTWDGTNDGKLVEPGTYSVILTASKLTGTPVTSAKTLTVAYGSANKPAITNFSLSPSSIDPDFDDTVIKFRHTTAADVTVEVRNSTDVLVRKFSDFQEASFTSDTDHSMAWNGKDDSGAIVALGDYKVVVLAKNSYGVTKDLRTVTLNNSKGAASYETPEVQNISLSPSLTFRPDKDNAIFKVKFDVKQDLDNLTITLVNGLQKVEIYNEDDLKAENNLQATWDGRDESSDTDYAATGSWKVLFKSKKGSTVNTAVRSIDVSYEKPRISDLVLSKDKFDNSAGESTNIIFRVDHAAKIKILVLKDGKEDETVTEDMDVEKNVWYSVAWDGSGYDYSDNLSLKVVANNIVSDTVSDSEKINVDLAEEKYTSGKANITNDFVSPSLMEVGGTLTLSYSTDETADVVITVHKGKSSSGSRIIELLNVKGQKSGTHEFKWNGKDENNNDISKEFYTYKIVATSKGTDTETGVFAVGNIGSAESSFSSNSSTKNNKISPNVVSINGENTNIENSSEKQTDNPEVKKSVMNCGDFSDVITGSPYCLAIGWAKENGIFSGYADGTFKPNQAINRAEFLKVLFPYTGLDSAKGSGSKLGFKDADENAWYTPFLKAAKSYGILNGDQGKSTVRPAATVNRAEALKFLFESMRIAADLKIDTNSCSNYSDVKTSNWYYKYGCAAKKYELFEGNLLYPDKLMTRGEVAKMFSDLILSLQSAN